MKQLSFLESQNKAYGGELLKKRKGRLRGRPLSTTSSMHLVLRSTKAVGEKSFRTLKNSKKVSEIVERFTRKYSIKLISFANAGNHLHFQIQLKNRYTYKPFIRGMTSAIAMAVGGRSRWNKGQGREPEALTTIEGTTKALRGTREALSTAKIVVTKARVRESKELREKGFSEAKKNSLTHVVRTREHFWDYRPFTRVVIGYRAFLTLKDYIEINEWEGKGFRRSEAQLFVVAKEFERRKFWTSG